jgi:hypothetical protein
LSNFSVGREKSGLIQKAGPEIFTFIVSFKNEFETFEKRRLKSGLIRKLGGAFCECFATFQNGFEDFQIDTPFVSSNARNCCTSVSKVPSAKSHND